MKLTKAKSHVKPISLVIVTAFVTLHSAGAAESLTKRYDNLSCSVFQVTAGENLQGSPVSAGTGFFIDPNGRMVTAAHVLLSGAKDELGNSLMRHPQKIILRDKTEIDISATDDSYPDKHRLFQSDLVVVETGHKTNCFLPIGSDESVGVGDHVVSIGYPASSEAVLYEGTLSARQRAIVAGTEDIFVHLRVQLPVTAGTSGSPLLTDDDKVVGIIVQVPLSVADVVNKFLQDYRKSHSAVLVDNSEIARILGDLLGAVRGYETPGTALVVPVSHLGNLGVQQHQKDHDP